MKIIAAALLAAGAAFGAGYRAGTARVDITPEMPFWLTGYAARTKPAETVLQPIWAKALALHDGKGGRVVIVTADLLGIGRETSTAIADAARHRYGLKRSELLLNFSHTHSGPVVWPAVRVLFDFDAAEQKRAEAYTSRLRDNVVQVIGAALKSRNPARVSYGFGETGFAANRRLRAAKPVDHAVPVIRVDSLDGKPLAMIFGYACHNTTLTAEFNQVSGDYAGFAQIEIEKAYPGAQAMFLMLAGGDQNPFPRSTLELAEQHGRTLAAEAQRVASGTVKPARPEIRAAYEEVTLAMAPHTREQFEADLKSTDVYQRRRARLLLNAYEERHPLHGIPYPVHAVRLGELTILALGGELVVDYALRAKREFGGDLIVAGYSNEVPTYIPSVRVLKEGGYEGGGAMVYYGLPVPFTEGVEEEIFGGIRAVLRRTGAIH